MAKDKKTTDPLAAAAVGTSALDDFDAAPTSSATEPAVPPEEPVLPPPGEAAAKAVKAPQFEVVRDVTISWGNAFIKLRAGDVISEDGYGDGAIERMKQAGVALKEVEG